jgi:uncharacterized paraquat-inducible protein A
LSPEPMDEPQSRIRADVCHRCLEPVPPKAARCPRCGEPIHKPANFRKILAVFGLLMFVVVAVVAFRLMQTSSPPSTDAQQQKDASPPEKKPVLGQ